MKFATFAVIALLVAATAYAVSPSSLPPEKELQSHGAPQFDRSGGENIGSYGNATVVNIKVQVKISDKELIKRLFEAKPTYVYMTLVTPEFTSRQKIPVEYQTQE